MIAIDVIGNACPSKATSCRFSMTFQTLIVLSNDPDIIYFLSPLSNTTFISSLCPGKINSCQFFSAFQMLIFLSTVAVNISLLSLLIAAAVILLAASKEVSHWKCSIFHTCTEKSVAAITINLLLMHNRYPRIVSCVRSSICQILTVLSTMESEIIYLLSLVTDTVCTSPKWPISSVSCTLHCRSQILMVLSLHPVTIYLLSLVTAIQLRVCD